MMAFINYSKDSRDDTAVGLYQSAIVLRYQKYSKATTPSSVEQQCERSQCHYSEMNYRTQPISTWFGKILWWAAHSSPTCPSLDRKQIINVLTNGDNVPALYKWRSSIDHRSPDWRWTQSQVSKRKAISVVSPKYLLPPNWSSRVIFGEKAIKLPSTS